jgi:hypothetical protein
LVSLRCCAAAILVGAGRPLSGMEMPGATIEGAGSTMSVTHIVSMTSAGATALVALDRNSSTSSSLSPAIGRHWAKRELRSLGRMRRSEVGRGAAWLGRRAAEGLNNLGPAHEACAIEKTRDDRRSADAKRQTIRSIGAEVFKRPMPFGRSSWKVGSLEANHVGQDRSAIRAVPFC